MAKKVEKHIKLLQEEREKLLKIIHVGNAKEALHAHILLLSDENYFKGNQTPQKVADVLNVSKQTINNVKQRYIKEGLENALKRKNIGKAPFDSKFTGDVEAKIVALACTKSPEGTARWTLRLLSDKVVELEILNQVSHTAISSVLKKHNLSLI